MTEATSEYDLNTPNNLHQTVWPKLSLSGKKFIGNDVSCLVLGDNFFHGNDFSALLCEAVRTTEEDKKTIVFGYWVSDSERYGVVDFDKDGNCLSIEENRSIRN